jgi:hypothetical protein
MRLIRAVLVFVAVVGLGATVLGLGDVVRAALDPPPQVKPYDPLTRWYARLTPYAAVSQLRLLQLAVALAGFVPVLAGGAGVLLGPAMVGGLLGEAAADSHFRYLSGLLLAIGLGFWSTIPDLPATPGASGC